MNKIWLTNNSLYIHSNGKTINSATNRPNSSDQPRRDSSLSSWLRVVRKRSCARGRIFKADSSDPRLRHRSNICRADSHTLARFAFGPRRGLRAPRSSSTFREYIREKERNHAAKYKRDVAERRRASSMVEIQLDTRLKKKLVFLAL